MNGEEAEETIRRLRVKVFKLREVLSSALSGKNLYDEGYCRYCWHLDGEHNPGCWADRAERVLKETGL